MSNWFSVPDIGQVDGATGAEVRDRRRVSLKEGEHRFGCDVRLAASAKIQPELAVWSSRQLQRCRLKYQV